MCMHVHFWALAMPLFGRVEKDKDDCDCLQIEGLKNYRYKSLLDKEEIARGGFATVFTACVPDENIKVVVKKYLRSDSIAKKIVLKEAHLLSTLNHPNVVHLEGICPDQFAILLEYVHFNYKPFGIDDIVTSLAEFLSVCECTSCDGIDSAVFLHAASDIAAGQ